MPHTTTTKPKRPSAPIRKPLPPRVKQAMTRPAPRRPQPNTRSGYRG